MATNSTLFPRTAGKSQRFRKCSVRDTTEKTRNVKEFDTVESRSEINLTVCNFAGFEEFKK